MPSDLILQKEAALKALRVKRGEKPFGTLDPYSKQLYDNLTEFALKEITLGRAIDILEFPEPDNAEKINLIIKKANKVPVGKEKIKKKKPTYKKKVETDNE